MPQSSSSTKYRHIGLDFNPFPLMPTPITAKFASGEDRKEKVRTITSQIARVKAGDSITMGIIGDYGLGKSHILRHIEYKLSEEPEMNPGENLVIYIHRPYDPREKCDLCYLCSLICECLDNALKEDFLAYLIRKLYSRVAIKVLETNEWKKLVRTGFGDSLVGFVRRQRSENHRKDLVSSLKDDFRSIYEKEEEVDFGKLRTAVIEELGGHFETRDADRPDYIDSFFLEQMADMFFEDMRQGAWERISTRFKTTNKEARKFLKTIVNISHYAGYRIFAILLDEIDQIPQPDLHMLLGELTLFLEESGEKAPPPHLFFILSYTPKLESLSSFYERRLALKIGLERISKEDTRDTIVDYLNQARRPSESLAPFDNDSVASIWHSCRGGEVGDILKCCFWIVEWMATGSKLQEAVSRVLENTDALSPPPALEVTMDLVRPTPLDRERVLELYDSIEVNAERSKKLEDAVRALCISSRHCPLNSMVISSVASTRRMLNTNGGRKRSRAVDVYLTLHRGRAPEERLAIEVKAHKRDSRNNVRLAELEGPFELLDRGSIDRLIILSVTDFDIEVLHKIRQYGNKALKCQLDDDQLAQLLYCTDKYYFGRDLRMEEARQVAGGIGLLELLERTNQHGW